MDPISALLGGAGVGFQLLGGIFGSNDSERMAELQQQMAQKEGQLNQQRQQQMVLNSRRQQLEIIRNSQRARAMALNSAVNQGAQFGSGIAGGIGQIQGQENSQIEANSQNLQIGQNMFGIDAGISGLKLQMGQVQSNLATDQGYMSLGGALLKSAPTIGRIFGGGNYGSSSSRSSYNPFNITGSYY